MRTWPINGLSRRGSLTGAEAIGADRSMRTSRTIGATSRSIGANGSAGHPVTTLIVDDSADERGWLRQKLEGLGCVVVGEAESAAGGLERFEALHPRLVTLDIVMPEIEGMTAMDLLRHIVRQDPEVAVLVVTVRPPADSHDYLRFGAIGYLEKPFVDFSEAAKLLQAYFPELAAIRKTRIVGAFGPQILSLHRVPRVCEAAVP